MCKRSAILKLAILLVLHLCITLSSAVVAQDSTTGETSGQVYRISAIQSDLEGNSLSFDIVGDAPPAFTVSERFAPFRVILDIAGAELSETLNVTKPFLPQNNFASMTSTLLKDQEPAITRFEITIADSHDYKVSRKGNDINVAIEPATKTTEMSPPSDTLPALTDFRVTSSPGQTTILIVADKPVTEFKAETIGGNADMPARMFIDVANVSIDELIREKQIGTAVDKIRVAPRATGARIVFDSSSQELFEYKVTATNEGLQIVVTEDGTAAQAVAQNVSQPSSEATDTVTDPTLDALIESSTSLLAQETDEASEPAALSAKAEDLQDSFAFSGYTKQRISIDFYKIDIHNVFRLFRQITDLNIIVDEDVKGTITLALDDVPWDFALDIVLNLTDLKKEERYNTIVIYPKKKEFVWPERAEDNLSFEADVEVVAQEALIIQQSANQPKEILEAQELIRKGREAEQKEEYEDAASLYEQAITLWPDNSKLYNRLSTLYLVHLGLNAKASFYAKESLNRDPDNPKAALYAAIAAANMQRIEEANEYFAQSISGTPPMKEALISYASFSENNEQHTAALKLLDKYNAFYGETVDTMLAKARIFDKLGESQQATEQYKAILASGFQLRPDLKKYILGRIAAGNF